MAVYLSILRCLPTETSIGIVAFSVYAVGCVIIDFLATRSNQRILGIIAIAVLLILFLCFVAPLSR